MKNRVLFLLFLILLLASSLRIYGLSRSDTLSDEVLYGFRAVAMLDFDEAADQTTPLEWFDPNIPFWTHLSFHDHPPLVFLIQHASISIFGESNFGMRFPSALFGVASIYFLYLIGSLLYSRRVGLLASALLSVTISHVFISRAGLQESFVIFFLLVTIYFLLKALRKENYFILAGIFFGLGLLTKYNTFILAPIFLTYLLICRRDLIINKKLLVGALLSLLIFSPVIIYNIKLYQARGHFDFQLSYVLNQPHPEWQIEPGKEIGSLGDRIKNYLPELFTANSWLFVSLFFAALISFIWSLFQKPKETLSRHSFLMIAMTFLALLMLVIGPSTRFLSMITPFFALTISVFLYNLYQISASWRIIGREKIALSLLSLVLIFEIVYSINTQILYYPKGSRFWTWSEVRFDNYNWGYNNLADYLARELAGKMPEFAFDQKYKFIENIHGAALKVAAGQKLEPYPALIVYDSNMQTAAQLWVLDRLQIYHAWPVIKTETYLSILKENGLDYFTRQGFKYFYFIRPTDNVTQKRDHLTDTGKYFEENLKAGGKTPIVVRNLRGDEAFHVYKY